MPTHQDRYEINLELVTIAGTVYAMQADLSHYENVAELEDDILCFLPTVSDLDVFGCELELLNLHTQQPLPEAFGTRPSVNQVTPAGCLRTHRFRTQREAGADLQINSIMKPSSGNTSFKGASTLLRLLCVRFHLPEGQRCKLGPTSSSKAFYCYWSACV